MHVALEEELISIDVVQASGLAICGHVPLPATLGPLTSFAEILGVMDR
jgi:hypothetical protein